MSGSLKEGKNKLIFGVNDLPPPGHLLVSAFQHIMLMIMSLSVPIIFASQINGSEEFTINLITFSMLAAGAGSIIQSVGIPFIGSGYLCPNICGPSYLSVSLSAAWVGGMPLMRGMIIIAGIVEMILAPVVEKLRRVFPTYIVGLVVAMVGISVIKNSVSSLFGLEYRGDAISSTELAVGVFSLMVMVLANLWGKGIVKMYCLLLGMLAGWGLALLIEPAYLRDLSVVGRAGWFALPHFGREFFNIKVSAGMLVPFVIIAISGSLKSFGNLLAAQSVSEPDLDEVKFGPIKKGLLADGFSTALAGLLGGVAVDTSSSNVGLAAATRVVSRWISVVAGGIFILLAFSPKLVAALSVMPRPVLGASIIFAASFMICIGLRETFSQKWDNQKTFVVGISIIFGLSTAFLPNLYARVPGIIRALFANPLPTTTILAVVLNLLFNAKK